MEKDTYTITFEISHETAVYLLLMAAGVVAVYLAYTMQQASTELWPALNAAGIAALAYLVVLLIYTLRGLTHRGIRIITAVGALLAVGAVTLAWTGMYETTRWQHDELLRIRTIVGRGESNAEQEDALLAVLERHHTSQAKGTKSLIEAFSSVYPDAHVGQNVRRPRWQSDTAQVVFLTSLTKDSVVLVCVDKIARGNNGHYVNLNGDMGRVQERYVLTEKGLRHGTDN